MMNSDRIGRILWWGGLAVLLLGIGECGYSLVGWWASEPGDISKSVEQSLGISIVVIFLISPIVMLVGAIFKAIAFAEKRFQQDQEN